MSQHFNTSRREFLKLSAVTGTSLIIGMILPGCDNALDLQNTPESAAPTAQVAAAKTTSEAVPSPEAEATAVPFPQVEFEPNIYLKIDESGQVTFSAFRSEMGQGIRTALAMIAAEELDADWNDIAVKQAPADRAYGDQHTGGSTSVSGSYATVRRAGATARLMLIQAAAQMWDVSPGGLITEPGVVVNPATDERLAYGDLVTVAATLPLPENVQTKAEGDFRIIGQGKGLCDGEAIVGGTAVYGMDVRLPGMKFAAVERPPRQDGRLSSFDDTVTRAVPGVLDVLKIDSGVAVVAENTWAAFEGKKALDITWDDDAGSTINSAEMRVIVVELATPSKKHDDRFEAIYEMPFEAHATMEPMNCTADVRADGCEVWAPSQNPQPILGIARKITGLANEQITVHTTLLGGGFGRRLENDYTNDAIELSKALGMPIQVVWTRTDDMRHDYYHPMSANYVSARIDENGFPTGLPRSDSFKGIGARTGFWRSVSNVSDAFAIGGLTDELAAANGIDTFDLLSELLPGSAAPLLELAREKSNWDTPLPEGWGRGVAFHNTWSVTPVVQVAEVSVENNNIRVQRVVCVLDCGKVINPDSVAAQMEGGIVFGLTAALKNGITLENGAVQESNFHDYPILQIDEMPVIEVYTIDSEDSPSGVGEMGVPPIAPAVANAIFAATGQRLRQMPFRLDNTA